MKKVIALILLTIALMISSCATTSKATTSDTEATTEVEKMSGTLLYVGHIDVGVILSHDSVMIKHLEEMGFTVTPKHSVELTGAEAADYDYIYMSETNGSVNIKDKFIDAPNPIMSCEMWIGDEMGFTGPEKNVDNGNKEYVYKEINIVTPNHPIAAGLSGVVPVLSAKGIIAFGKPGGDVTIVASAPDDPQTAFIYVYEKGAKNKLGNTVPGLRVWHYWFANQEEIATDDAWKIWEAAVRYTFKS